MSVPRQIAPYDKRGSELLLRDMKRHLFGDPSYRMTKARCEAFFDDLGNFA
jgi:hypothetical protein